VYVCAFVNVYVCAYVCACLRSCVCLCVSVCIRVQFYVQVTPLVSVSAVLCKHTENWLRTIRYQSIFHRASSVWQALQCIKCVYFCSLLMHIHTYVRAHTHTHAHTHSNTHTHTHTRTHTNTHTHIRTHTHSTRVPTYPSCPPSRLTPPLMVSERVDWQALLPKQRPRQLGPLRKYPLPTQQQCQAQSPRRERHRRRTLKVGCAHVHR